MAANAANAVKANASIINTNSANLLRFGALGFGILYGFTRKHSLTRYVEQRERAREEEEERRLLEEAKIAFKAQCDREESELARRDGVPSTDIDNYKFDAEKYLNWLVAQSEKAPPASAK
ncbi:hypothetical protein HK104_004804 [Borealophlyctis nickersoniae]|nr:hypothetical protein HK104_004804 [Borealophlyctis nickersoniae]